MSPPSLLPCHLAPSLWVIGSGTTLASCFRLGQGHRRRAVLLSFGWHSLPTAFLLLWAHFLLSFYYCVSVTKWHSSSELSVMWHCLIWDILFLCGTLSSSIYCYFMALFMLLIWHMHLVLILPSVELNFPYCQCGFKALFLFCLRSLVLLLHLSVH